MCAVIFLQTYPQTSQSRPLLVHLPGEHLNSNLLWSWIRQ